MNAIALTHYLKRSLYWTTFSFVLSLGLFNHSLANESALTKDKQTHIADGACYVQQQILLLDLKTNIFVGEDPIAALKSGLTLHFLYEFNIKEAGKWLAQTVELKREFRLRYNPVAQTFVYEDPITLKQVNHNSLDEALVAMGAFTALPLLDITQLPLSGDAGAIEVKARFLLNEELLPVSLRFSALIDEDWDIESGWWTCRVDV